MLHKLIRIILPLALPLPAFASADTPSLIEEGRRLVEQVGMCIDCHSPRLPSGEFDRTRWLQGAPLGFKPVVEMPWMSYAPSLVGLPGYTDEQAIKFLTTGERPGGVPVLPPMPPYRFNKSEATAILAYLRSLKPAE
jgi:hypothetical protein